MSAPLGLDTQLREQLSLVKNAQDGLRQSLALHSEAGSEEQQTRARMLVQSRMSQAKDLLLTFQAMMEIRKELTVAYKGLMNRETSENSCQEQVQWLENRLGKLLIALRRDPHRYSACTTSSPQLMHKHNILASTQASVAFRQLSHYQPSTPRLTLNPRLTPPTNQMQDEVKPSAESLSKLLMTPQPVDMFGVSSWNALPLAVNTNFVKNEMIEVSATKEIAPRHTMLESMSKELMCLQKLIKCAAQAATVQGVMLPDIHCQASLCQASSLLSAADMHTNSSGSEKERFSLAGESLPKITEESMAHMVSLPEMRSHQISRKVYGKKTTAVTFPRSSNTWSPGKQVSSPKHPRTQSVGHVLEYSYRNIRSGASRKRCKSAKTSRSNPLHCAGSDDFDIKKHHFHRINFLLEMLDSTNVEVRRTASQAFGSLLCDDIHQFRQILINKLLQDSDMTVRYLGVKSLLSLGIVEETVQCVTIRMLSEGSSSLQCDLLQLLTSLLQLKDQQLDWSWCHNCLLLLLSGTNTEVAMLAACMLSYCQLERDKSIAMLLDHITSATPKHKNQALHCLVVCWKVKNADIVSACMSQLQSCGDWKMRLSAVEMLKMIGRDMLSKQQNVFEILLLKITNEPIQTVKQAIGKLLAELDMEKKAQKVFLEGLESTDETARAKSAVALRAFDLRGPRIAQLILDYYELDSSNYVRIQLIRTLGHVKCHSHEVMQRLADKCRGSGTAISECKIVLEKMKQNLGLLDEE